MKTLLKCAAAAAVLAFATTPSFAQAPCPPDSMESECLKDEAWRAAQWAVQTSAAQALSQVSARFASGDDALARLVTERERAVRERASAQEALYEALSLSDAASREAGSTNTRQRLDTVTAELAALEARLSAEFPEYAELTSPSPLSITQTQALLRDDEAMILILAGDRGSFVFAIDRQGADWARVDLTSDDLSQAVDTLRQSLDPAYGRGPWNTVPVQSAGSGLDPFDRAEAYRLYQALLAPIESRLAGKRHVYAVPSGALSSLPLGVMVTAEPQGDDSDPRALAGTAWLARDFAMTVLPTPASLRALSRFGQSQAQSPFFGVGDPCIGSRAGANCDRGQPASGGGERGAAPASFRGVSTRGVFNADVDAVRSLAALPNTRPELVALARAFGADPDRDLLVGARATESALRGSANLRDQRVIAFATHGLIADELPGLVEPALVLTPPGQAIDGDDGLLTASEIAAYLDLDADWVILSACNTAAPGGAGADSLSGLASAFFYAGARSLLVSHWVVDDTAARRITTGALAAMNDNPEAGRSEALRQSLLALMEEDQFAHPAMWAPFVLVGQNRPIEG
jgi:CHAT domain-containing protein